MHDNQYNVISILTLIGVVGMISMTHGSVEDDSVGIGLHNDITSSVNTNHRVVRNFIDGIQTKMNTQKLLFTT